MGEDSIPRYGFIADYETLAKDPVGALGYINELARLLYLAQIGVREGDGTPPDTDVSETRDSEILEYLTRSVERIAYIAWRKAVLADLRQRAAAEAGAGLRIVRGDEGA
jgi:hypothetical protein